MMINPFTYKNIGIPKPNQKYDNLTGFDVEKSTDIKDVPWDFAIGGGTFKNNSKYNGASWYKEDFKGNKINSDAVIALFSGANDTGYLAYSNNGEQFKPICRRALDLSSVPFVSGLRDFSTVTVNSGKKLVSYVAGADDHKFYIIESNDGYNWKYTNKTIDLTTLGSQNLEQYSNQVVDLQKIRVESPYVTTISGQPIMIFGAQNPKDSTFSGAAYVTGHFDSDGIFQIDSNSKTGSIDQGFDVYGANAVKLDENNQIFLGWLGNWNVGFSGHQGGLSLSRVLQWRNGQLYQIPIDPGDVKDLQTSNYQKGISNTVTTSQKLDVKFNEAKSSFHINFKRKDNSSNIDVVFNNGYFQVKRENGVLGNKNYQTSFNTGVKNISNIQFYVDNTSIEIYIPEIGKMFTLLSYANVPNSPYAYTIDSDAVISTNEFDINKNIELLSTKESAQKLASDADLLSKIAALLHISVKNSKYEELDQKVKSLSTAYGNCDSQSKSYDKQSNGTSKYAYIAIQNSSINVLNTQLQQLEKSIFDLINENSSNLNHEAGFITIDPKTTMYFNGHTFVKGIQKIDGKIYFFNSNGVLSKNEFNDFNNKTIYSNSDGVLAKGLSTIDDKLYFFDDENNLVKNRVLNIESNWYFSDSKTGILKELHLTGGFFSPDGENQYYFDKLTNQLLIGFQHIDNKKLYFNTLGQLIKGNFFSENNAEYYADPLDGHIVTGRNVIGGYRYYFDSDGKKIVGLYFYDKGNWFHANSVNGRLDTGLCDIDGHWKYFTSEGMQVFGKFFQNNGKWYHTNQGDGEIDTGLKLIDGHWKYFTNEGVQIFGKYFENNGKWYHANSFDGEIDTGLKLIDGEWKYFNKDGSQVFNQDIWVNGKKYHADSGSGKVEMSTSGYLFDPSVNGYRWFENGQLYTGFRYYMGTYYWFVNGVRQNRGWHEAWGRLYYTDDNGRAVQGIYNINGQNFDFGNDGSYYLRSSGYLYDGSSQNGGYRWYENGKLFTGFRYYMGTYYWFVDGVRQNAGWRQAWGMTYYTDATGRAVQGIQTIDGKAYNFGTDNTYYERPVSGYIYDGSSQNGGYRWYENGNLFTGFRFYMGTYYWFIDGVRQNAGWREAWGMKYYTDANGRAVQGDQMIDGRHYFFGNDGSYYLR
ncbi:hypothetical protein [Fructobacillus durionis]|uniref:Sucrose-6-phosphate hydrolase SacC, GH32 family n=1 Tax=Fructobacillus durionis TaxID=283737 RepID=A0A1I1E310_9LACO|nr:hypothetical protein [Fructobacillus durionis]SFB81457.1 Sucrose-6-phosphate hydrolase SacC, GH32 family [Fructobacillus durionis]